MPMARQKTIMVIDPGVHTPELDTFNLISKLSEIPCTYHLPAMFGFDSFPANSCEIAGIVVLGSAASVYDNLAWQRPLESYVAKMIDAGVPVLGCCYGLQMLAFMFGAKVGYVRSAKEKLKGVRRISILDNEVWSRGERSVIVTHAEMLTEIPAEFSLLATSDQVSIEGIYHAKKPVFGFQFHPEATRVFLAGHDMLNETTESSLSDGQKILSQFVHMAASGKF
jgi:GMP synthase (glutamine-hydrolysing)